MRSGALEIPNRKHLPLVSKIAAALIMAAAVLSLFGWVSGFEALLRILPSVAPMNPVTALTLIAAGISLCRLARVTPPRAGWRPERVGLALASVVTLVGGVELVAHVFGLNLHITFSSGAPRGLSEIPPNTALEFFLSGLALLLLDVETQRGIRPAQALILLVGFIAMMALIGYGYQVSLLYRVGSARPMSLGTAVCFFLLTLGLLAARPDRGLMNVVTSSTTGGAMARRLLPVAILVPWVLGALLLRGEQAGYYPRQFATSIFGGASIVIFTALIWWNAKLLHAADLERLRTERRLAAQHNSTRVLAESTSLAGAFPTLFQVICGALGWRVGVLWTFDPQAKVLRCAQWWHSPVRRSNLDEFLAATKSALLARAEDLPGRVWDSSQPAWLRDLAAAPQHARTVIAQKSGLRAGCGFPIWIDAGFFGVMEFYSPSIEPRDEALLEMLASVCTQAGLFVERMRAEAQLRETSANLQRSNTELQQFAYVASHDLFEPLRMITSYLQLLSHRYHDKLDNEAKEFINLATDGAKRMNALIHDLLAYSRVDAHGRSFVLTDCEEVLQSALANLKVAIEEAGATVTHDPLPLVMADSVQLTQVFQNLIGNAIKFHGPDPPRIAIQAIQVDHQWQFSVRDNGIGIDSKYFERIFVLFQRLHTRQEYAGTGMGLAICKKIIQRHGGRIWVESKPCQGTTFFFTLPVADGRPRTVNGVAPQ